MKKLLYVFISAPLSGKHYIHPIPYEEWLEYAIQRVVRSDIVLCLGRSGGTDTEVAVAIEHNIPVYYSVDELLSNVEPTKSITLSAYTPERVAEILKDK